MTDLLVLLIIAVVVLTMFTKRYQNENNNEKAEKLKKVTIWAYIALVIVIIITIIPNEGEFNWDWNKSKQTFKILSSTENKDIEDLIKDYAKKEKIDLEIEYAGNLDIIDKINSNEDYNAIWVSNSMWYYMLNNPSIVQYAKSTSINPVVFGIKKSKAEELGFIGKDIYTRDILNAIRDKKLEFVMTSPIRTNTGATAYLGFLSTLLNNPEIITPEMLQNKNLKEDIRTLFSGVNRVSGSEEFLEEMFLNGDFEAVVNYETSLININKKLEKQKKEPLYLIYPVDGVAINDSSFGYINGESDKLETFKKIQDFLLSSDTQNKLVKTGRRVWYGGISNNAPKDVFNREWGIDTTKYLTAVKFPSKNIINEALVLYQSELRKPSHTIFLLDYSGSMQGEGKQELSSAMEYILTEEKAKENLLQFTERDKITVIPFNGRIIDTWTINNGNNTKDLLDKIINLWPTGETNIYDPSIKALEILQNEDQKTYNLSIVLMTDGESNNGSYYDLQNKYNRIQVKLPVYSIMFGNSNQKQLNSIADLTNGRVFDGKTNLLEAFKEVRGYN